MSTESPVESAMVSDWLGLQTVTARTSLSHQLTQWTSHPATLANWSKKANHLQKELHTHPELYTECREHFRVIAECEKSLSALWDASELEKGSYGELLFLRPLLHPLNSVPFLLTIWSLLRIYLLPGISLLIPLLALLAPYLILTYVICIPLTFSHYIAILHSLFSGQLDATCPLPNEAPSLPPSAILKQLLVVGATLLQSIVQPYWTYQHLRSIDTILQEHGNRILDLQARYGSLRDLLSSHGITLHRCPLPVLHNARHAVSQALLHPMYFRLVLTYVGTLEVRVELLRKPEIHSVRWVSADTPVFRIQDTFDIQVPADKRKSFSVSFDQQRHALLTGPNKGGKSTVLRALSFSALLAHTYGCSVGHLEATPFYRMLVCLKPDDLPGSKSRFEREIEFTAHTLTYNRPILVLLDELYHSTNPPDALYSCIQYSERLWKRPQCVSVISTHLFDWVEQADPEVQRLCCSAYYDEARELQFTYQLTEGVCRVSSVELLLRKNGLCV